MCVNAGQCVRASVRDPDIEGAIVFWCVSVCLFFVCAPVLLYICGCFGVCWLVCVCVFTHMNVFVCVDLSLFLCVSVGGSVCACVC